MSWSAMARLAPHALGLEHRQLNWLSIGHVWVLAAIVPVVTRALALPVPPLDFWWHLKVGEIIYTTRAIPRVDLFSFTAAGQTFVHQNWLAELTYYTVYLAGGLPLLVLINAALLGLAVVLILDLSIAASNSLRLAGLTGILLAGQMLPFLIVRPATFSIALFTIFLWVIGRYRRGQAGWLWTLPPLMILWVNLHGAFVLGPVLLTLVIIGEVVQRVIQPAKSDNLSWHQLQYLAIVTILVVLGTGINPEGIGVYDYVWTVQTDVSSQELVQEWQVANIRDVTAWPFFLALFIGFLAFIYAPRRPGVADLVLYCAFAAFAMAALRNMIWFALVSTPILTRQLASIQTPIFSAQTGVWAALARIFSRNSRPAMQRRDRHGILNTVLAGLMLTLPVLMSPWIRPYLTFLPLQPGLEDPRTPSGAVQFIEQQNIQGRIFHPQIYGDYLDWRLGERRQVFVDGRVHLYGKSIVEDYLLLLNGYERERLLKHYGIQLILLDRSDKRSTRLRQDIASSPAWEVLYEDSQSILFGLKDETPAGSPPGW